MPHDAYYQFLTTPGQSRRSGARGGKATARNRRERRDGAAAELPEVQAGATPQVAVETTAAAIALLDTQYPWLCGAERRGSGTVGRARGLTTVRLC